MPFIKKLVVFNPNAGKPVAMFWGVPAGGNSGKPIASGSAVGLAGVAFCQELFFKIQYPSGKRAPTIPPSLTHTMFKTFRLFQIDNLQITVIFTSLQAI